MKKTCFILLMTLLFSANIHAQEAYQQKGEIYLRPYAEIDFIDPPRFAYALAENKSFSIEHYGFGISTDYGINTWSNIGLGIEAYGSHEGWTMNSMLGTTDRMVWTLPIYGNFRARLGNWKPITFSEVQLGYAFALNTVTVLPNQNIKAKGLFWGINLGLNFNNHEIILGGKCVPISGNLINIHTGETTFQKDIILNICLRYAYRIRVN